MRHTSQLLFLTLFFTTSSAFAQLHPSMDSTRLKAARENAALNPLGIPLRDQANRDIRALGLSPDDSFELINAHQDERGGTHARLQQYYRGVPVHGGRLIAHRDASGLFLPYTDNAVRNITTSEIPRYTADEAIRIAENDPRHLRPFAVPPEVRLEFLPIYEYVHVRTGGPLPPRRYDPTHPYAMHEDIDAEEAVRRVSYVHLAYRVIGIEHDVVQDLWESREWLISAHEGHVIEARDLDESVTGNGTGFWAGSVTFQTTDEGSCFSMYDSVREFTTETEDFSSSHAVNCDFNNIWGDGNSFMGNSSATNANWQTMMVDGHHHATVFWDLMDNVFGMQGPDDDFYSVNVFMHKGTNHNNAHYHKVSGNVAFGDGSEIYSNSDIVGHELGHAWNDHNSGYSSGYALNESLADIFGVMTEVYKNSGNFATGSTNIGTAGNSDWNIGGFRNMINPAATNDPMYWHQNILDEEEHAGAGPANRAFAFLTRGASPWIRDQNWSRKIPWGMNGIGLNTAGRIFFHAHKHLLDDEDYQGLRWAMIQAAEELHGNNSTQENAVRNAYAGVNVGSRAGTYPALPPATSEVEPNNLQSSAQNLGTGMAPPAGAVFGAPRKIRLIGSGAGTDWYKVRLTGNLLGVLLTPLYTPGGSTYSISIRASNGAILASGGASASPQYIEGSQFVTGDPYDLYIRVVNSTGNTGALYTLDIDLKI